MFVLVLAVVLLLCYPSRAFAYLDPGAGSFLVQWLIAGLIGGLVALKASWRKIVVMIRSRSPQASAGASKDPDER